MAERLREIFPGKLVFIAEIGMNHNGDSDLAKRMIESAGRAGADAVKFQTFTPEFMNSVYTTSLLAGGAEGEPDSSQQDFFKRHALTADEFHVLFRHARDNGVEFFSSPFDPDSVQLLEDIGVRLYKVASSEVTNHILLQSIAKTEKPVIMSTGIAHEDEIASAIDTLIRNGTPEIVLLHCVSLYPLSREQANMMRIQRLRDRFQCEIGFSDHTRDSTAIEIAAALGARVFEKHFTLHEEMECPDADVSIGPERFREMRKSVDAVLEMLGDGHISYDDEEKDVARSARRSLFARRDIPAGTVIAMDDIIPKRPGVGLPVYAVNRVLGRRSRVTIRKDFLLRDEYFE